MTENFIKFDIREFYPSITEDILKTSLSFAKGYQDVLNSKAAEVNIRLELVGKQRGLPHISHCETIDLNKHLNESNLHLNSYGIRVFAETFSNLLSKSN